MTDNPAPPQCYCRACWSVRHEFGPAQCVTLTESEILHTILQPEEKTLPKPSKGRRVSCKSREIFLRVEGDLQGSAAEKILNDARERGLVSTYDVGRQFTWFEGTPGQALRELRQALENLAPNPK